MLKGEKAEMKVLITGTSQGIGKAIAEAFLNEGHAVVGIDRQPATITHEGYVHYVCDVRDYGNLPDVDGVEILINNAGTQNEADIDINLKALIHITEKYGVREGIKSILNIGSASAHTGAEFPEYCASKGGVPLEIIQKSGAWFSYNGERIGQGKDNARKTLEENPALMAEIEEKIREMSAQGNLGDAEFDIEEDEEDEFDIRTLKNDDDMIDE